LPGREWKPILAGAAGLLLLVSWFLGRENTALVLAAIIASAAILGYFFGRRVKSDWQEPVEFALGRLIPAAGCWGLLMTTIIFPSWDKLIAWSLVTLTLLSVWIAGKYEPGEWLAYGQSKGRVIGLLKHEGILITVKYEGRCVFCSRAIPPGEKALWKKGVGIWHQSCN